MAEKRNNAVGPQIRAITKRPDIGIQRALVIMSFLLGMMAATQTFAYIFSYQDALGDSFHHLYAPWKILEWGWIYYHAYPRAIEKAESAGIVVSSVLMIATFCRSMMTFNSSKTYEFMHGSARWANKNDIKAASLLGNDGVYVGAWIDKNNHDHHHYLRHNGPEHILCFPAIYGQQPLYFQDPVFKKRSEVPAPKATDKLTT